MRALWTLLRILVLLASLVVLTITPLFVSSPSGTSIEPAGAIIDAIAVVALVFVASSLWRDRRALI